MKKIYPIKNPMEISDYDKNQDIFDSQLPSWLREKMEKVAKLEKCHIRDLRYKREMFFLPEDMRWIDMGEIIYEDDKC
jgi:hypothetical protein